MKLTKNDMARVITEALWNMSELPEPGHHWVRREARAPRHHVLERYELARKILEDGRVRG